MLMGSAVGFALERRWVRFEPGGLWSKQVARLLLGLVVILALRFGLKALFDGLEPEPVFRFIRYSTMGLWFSAGAPWLFVKLNLAQCSGQRLEGITIGQRLHFYKTQK